MGEPLRFFDYVFEGDTTARSSLDEMLDMFEFLKPKPSAYPLIRIGENRDGAYIVPDDLDGIAACFSPGVNNTKDFEDVLADRYGIVCHLCDYSSDLEKFKTPLKEGKQTFQKKWLGVTTSGDYLSLADWMAACAPEGDLLLQMDIEGAEFRILQSLSDETLRRFRIIVIELHYTEAMTNRIILQNAIAPMFKRLDKHFSVVHAHGNNCRPCFTIPGTDIDIPNVLELTLSRKDRLTAPTYAPQIPHPLDISRNELSCPPLILGKEWLDGPRSLRSSLKIAKELTKDRAIFTYHSMRTRLGRVMQAFQGGPPSQ